jgi:cyclophilin family peptidyl-prolyl cis-trans isomerase
MKVRLCASLILAIFGAPLAALRGADATAPALPNGLYAEITTPRGTLTAELFFTQAPLTVASFVGLAEGTLGPAPGKPFFNGLKFHRVVADFVVQGGDPLGTGEGGPGYTFADEFVPGLRHSSAGVLSMANSGPATNGSQFFITLRDTNRLNYLHSVFGRVVRGLEILPSIKQDDTMSVHIVRIGTAAQKFQADEAHFPALVVSTKLSPASDPAAVPAPMDASGALYFDDTDHLLPTDPPRAKTFGYKLANLERATGVKIRVRLFAKSPPPADDAKAGQFMRALAQKLGTLQRGAVVAYFADEKDWRVWIGDATTPAFLGRPTAPADLVDDGAFHAAKDAFLAAAQAAGDAAFARQQATAPAGQPVPPSQQVKLQTDALLDALIFKLESK